MCSDPFGRLSYLSCNLSAASVPLQSAVSKAAAEVDVWTSLAELYGSLGDYDTQLVVQRERLHLSESK